MLVDVHAHLTFEQFSKDLEQVIERARKTGVVSILCSGVDHESNVKVLELSKKYNIIKASLGIYPLDAVGLGHYDDVPREAREIDVDAEIEFIRKNKENILAIGEIGLDKSPEGDCKLEEQKDVFWKSIKLAEEIRKPIVVHTRKAEVECIEILESSKTKNVVLHCFTGNLKLVKKAEDLGFYLSIPAIVTRLKHFQEVIQKVSMKNLLTETDAPYLSPFKGERNEPSYIKETIKIIAKIKNLTEEEVENIIFSNYQKVFMRK
ncbi:TatD family hydrolase [Candidatus Woesearchaeota archaeon]|nr:TatD family hydrolase [Candidatus Woesearchaeota archaeon]